MRIVFGSKFILEHSRLGQSRIGNPDEVLPLGAEKCNEFLQVNYSKCGSLSELSNMADNGRKTDVGLRLLCVSSRALFHAYFRPFQYVAWNDPA